MLRKALRSVSRGRERERSPSPEFGCAGAKLHDASWRANSGDRTTQLKDTFDPMGGSSRSPSSGDIPIYLDTHLEALQLEPLIRPTLAAMRPTLREREKLLPPMPELPAHTRRGSLTRPVPAALAESRQPLAREQVVLRAITPEITVTPPPPSPGHSRSSSSSEKNPFELEFGEHELPEITPLPKRPVLQRKAVSYRTHRELPLRVQAVRRSHQEEYARQILERSKLQREQISRRASESTVPQRPAPTPLQGRADPRSQSISHQLSPRARSRSASRSGSRTRHERMPSGPHRSRAAQSAEEQDFYLLAAMSSWSFEG